MPKKKSKSISSYIPKPVLVITVLAILIFGTWFGYRSLLNPLGINEVRTSDKRTLIREDYSREGSLCAQVYGHCLSADNKCVTYTDSCLKSKLCAQPVQSCTQPLSSQAPVTPTPMTSSAPSPTPTTIPPINCTSWFDGCNICQVKDGVVGICTRMACKDSFQAPKCLTYSDADPTPTGCRMVQVQCVQAPCEPVMMCPTPTATPVGSPVSSAAPTVNGIANFQAANPCGTNGFYNYSALCSNNTSRDLSSSSCTPLAVAIKYAEQFCRTEYQ